MTWLTAIQVVVAAGLGAVIGLEREVAAGLHVGGADPTRIAAQVVTGIGFLGGRAIVARAPQPRA